MRLTAIKAIPVLIPILIVNRAVTYNEIPINTGITDPLSTSQGTRSVGLRFFKAQIRSNVVATISTLSEIIWWVLLIVSITSSSAMQYKNVS